MVAVFVTATETFTEVVLVLVQVDVVTVVTIARVLIAVCFFRIEAPTVLPVSLSGLKAFAMAVETPQRCAVEGGAEGIVALAGIALPVERSMTEGYKRFRGPF